jgi:hypothetical protein
MPVVFRGYRMTEVDWLIEELASALEERDRELAVLRSSRARHARDENEPG